MAGASHYRTRLAFYPLARIRGVSCTSTTLRSSTGVSPGFDLSWPRSTGFGLPTRGSARSYHAIPDRERIEGRQRKRVPCPCPSVRHPGCGLSVSLSYNGLYRLNSPRIEAPWLVILDESCNPAPPASRLRLRWSLGSGSALSGCKGNSPTSFRLFSQTSRSSFQLSFVVLVRYRIPDVFRLGRSALPCWAGNFNPTYSFSGCQRVFAYGTVALFGRPFQGSSAEHVEALPAPHLPDLSDGDSARPLPVSLAVTSGIAFAFFSCAY